MTEPHFEHQRKLNRLAFYEDQLRMARQRRLEAMQDEEKWKRVIDIINAEMPVERREPWQR